MSPESVKLVSFRSVIKGALRGFAVVEFGGMEICDIAVFVKDGRSWVLLPSKMMVGKDGPLKDKDGRQRYSPICRWVSKEDGDRFSVAVCGAIGGEALGFGGSERPPWE